MEKREQSTDSTTHQALATPSVKKEKRQKPTDSTTDQALATPSVKKEKRQKPTDSGSTKRLARKSMQSTGGEVKNSGRKKANKSKKLDRPILEPTRRSPRLLMKKDSPFLPAFDGPSTSQAICPMVRDESE